MDQEKGPPELISSRQRNQVLDCLSAWQIRLTPEHWGLLDNYLCDVLEYNKKVNLTAAQDKEEILQRHCLDAWAALNPLRSRLPSRPSLIDVGSGAGFIGICLKIAWPESTMTLLEPSYRKFRFLNWTSARLRLKGLRVLHARAQALQERFHAVLARALAPLPEAIHLTLPLAADGGLVAIYQSRTPNLEDAALRKALSGGTLDSVLPYRLPYESGERQLVLIRRTKSEESP